jgi:hypothetical protein
MYPGEQQLLRTINPQRHGNRQRGTLCLRMTHSCAIRLGIAHTLVRVFCHAGPERFQRREADQRLLSKVSIVVFKPRAITCRVMIPSSRFPSSISEMCPRFMSKLTAISV